MATANVAPVNVVSAEFAISVDIYKQVGEGWAEDENGMREGS